MNVEAIRKLCMAMPHATEQVQWGADLIFKVGGKMFAGVCLEPPHRLSFKCSPERFAELTETEGIIPAPYMAKHGWLSIVSDEALSSVKLPELIAASYELVFSKLPKKKQTELRSATKQSKSSRAIKTRQPK